MKNRPPDPTEISALELKVDLPTLNLLALATMANDWARSRAVSFTVSAERDEITVNAAAMANRFFTRWLISFARIERFRGYSEGEIIGQISQHAARKCT